MAVVLNRFIPLLPAARPGRGWKPGHLLGAFIQACRVLWRDADTRFSLSGTSLFWGAGVTLRFLLVLWVPMVLGIPDNTTPTLLNALVAVGIVIGAGIAAKWITLSRVQRCMPAGVLIGIIVVLFTLQQHVWSACLLLILIGVLGGFFIVPLNALLQVKGKESVGAGNAIAVQNLGENGAMLLMLALYSLAVKLCASPVITGVCFGALFTLAIALLWVSYRKQATVRKV
ncbi:MAG: Lysophospholipid transporter LplT [Candidatus Erwinia impunctatus]|nr:Lysophospholipid transporter LplT [Culicoides impunctatus]